jgi:hypothetical protein
MQQDSNDPTGVSGQSGQGHGKELAKARNRKASAAVQMRLAGATWGEIATALGYPTPRQALVATERALVKQLDSDEDRDKMRKVAGARLERLLRSVWPKAIDPDSPDHLIAVSKAREIVDRHAKLYGLDAPTEVVVHNPTQTELEAWVTRLLAATEPKVVGYDIIAGEVESSSDIGSLSEPHAEGA